jgi:hypothetical protein
VARSNPVSKGSSVRRTNSPPSINAPDPAPHQTKSFTPLPPRNPLPPQKFTLSARSRLRTPLLLRVFAYRRTPRRSPSRSQAFRTLSRSRPRIRHSEPRRAPSRASP